MPYLQEPFRIQTAFGDKTNKCELNFVGAQKISVIDALEDLVVDGKCVLRHLENLVTIELKLSSPNPQDDRTERILLKLLHLAKT